MNTVGAVWGAARCRAYATEIRRKGRMICVGVQLAAAILLFVTLPWTVESPRYLVSRGKKEAALKNLKRLRTQEFCDAGL
jgi:hypothetical protein